MPSDVPSDDAAHEPKTMARVQWLVEAMWPKKPYNVWIEKGLRHVSVRFARGIWIEGSSSTWQGAFREIAAQVDAVRGNR